MQRRLSILPMLFLLAIACFSNAADIEGDTEHEYMPYWQINNQKFCAFPVIGSNAATK